MIQWWKRRRYENKVCNFWSQDWGRDTHICIKNRGHQGDMEPHECKCGAKWTSLVDYRYNAHRLHRIYRLKIKKEK